MLPRCDVSTEVLHYTESLLSVIIFKSRSIPKNLIILIRTSINTEINEDGKKAKQKSYLHMLYFTIVLL